MASFFIPLNRLQELRSAILDGNKKDFQKEEAFLELKKICKKTSIELFSWLDTKGRIEKSEFWLKNKALYEEFLYSFEIIFNFSTNTEEEDPIEGYIPYYLWIVNYYLENSEENKTRPIHNFLFADFLSDEILSMDEQEYQEINQKFLLNSTKKVEIKEILNQLKKNINKLKSRIISSIKTGEKIPGKNEDLLDKNFPDFSFSKDFPKQEANNHLYIKLIGDGINEASATLKNDVTEALKSPFLFSGKPEIHSQTGIEKIIFSLLQEFPHFEKVIHYLHGQMSLMKNTGFHLPPIMLLGKPSIGKTRFWERFSELSGIPFAAKSMASVTAGFILTGSDSNWRGGKMGFVASNFLRLKTPNPIIFLDEIDKSSQHADFNVANALLELLEPQTAKRFRDEYAPFLEFDISKVSFLSTANDSSVLPEPLLSRFVIFDVPEPSFEQRKKIIEIIHYEIFDQIGAKIIHLTPEVLDFVARKEWDFRQVRHHLREAMGVAAIRGDQVEHLSLSDFSSIEKEKKVSMGFTR